MYAIVDCNNFFVACERAFRPDLNDKPVIVLSNNDGCAVSRSNEAKPFIPMGAPIFKYDAVVKKEKIETFSANFRLYGDMSRRVMDVLQQFSPNIEQYSIDEAFIDLSKLSIDDVEKWAREIPKRIMKWTGISVSIGVAPTKTLAKLAVEYAKSDHGNHSWAVFKQTDAPELMRMPVEEVWGIGWRLTPRLKQFGIKNVGDLNQITIQWARQFAGATFMNTIQELRGMDIFGGSIQFNEPSKKTISATRTFGSRVTKQHELESAVANFVTRASFRMRKNKKLARELFVFAQNSKHDRHRSYVRNHIKLPVPTDNTGTLIQSAIDALAEVFESGVSYKRAGITLLGLVPRYAQQLALDKPQTESDFVRSDSLMDALDMMRTKYGDQALSYAVTQNKHWSSNRAKQTGAYTTSWLQLPVAY